jgi:hypothetical protein
VLNVDLGGYSFAVGSTQRLANGNYVFTSGFEGGRGVYAGRSIDVTPKGRVVYVQGVDTADYRAYRESSLYVGSEIPRR